MGASELKVNVAYFRELMTARGDSYMFLHLKPRNFVTARWPHQPISDTELSNCFLRDRGTPRRSGPRFNSGLTLVSRIGLSFRSKSLTEDEGPLYS